MSDGGDGGETGVAPVWADGEAYEKFMGQWSRLVGAEFLRWLAAAPGLAWLEVGCGTGAFTEIVLRDAAPCRFVALDPSAAQLVVARRRTAEAAVAYGTGDALALPAAADAFDIAVSALVLNFVADPARMAAELARVVRPGGTVALYVWDFAGRRPVTQHIAAAIAARDPQAARRAAAGQGFDTTGQKFLARLFAGAGLRAVETRAIDIAVTFRDFAAYWAANTEFASPVGQFVGALPPAERARFAEEVRQRLPIAADGSIAYTARANAVRGTVAA